MPIFHDTEFGDVTVRRSSLSRSIKLSVAPNGTLRISMPTYAPLFMAKRLLASSRNSIRKLQSTQHTSLYEDGMKIGKSHHLEVIVRSPLKVFRQGQAVVVQLPSSHTIAESEVQQAIRAVVIQALKKEAKSYLPRRLEFLANEHGFSYHSVRFSHASSRWGSCSSRKVISLNIALMKLSFEEIDYVLLHELSHTEHLDHSLAFWQRVETCMPNYKLHKAALKQQTPSV
jgi:predicted metal-dependent hydrolase